MINNEKRSATVKATSESVILWLDRKQFDEICGGSKVTMLEAETLIYHGSLKDFLMMKIKKQESEAAKDSSRVESSSFHQYVCPYEDSQNTLNAQVHRCGMTYLNN